MIGWDKSPKMKRREKSIPRIPDAYSFQVADFKNDFSSAFPDIPREKLDKIILDCIKQFPGGDSREAIINRIKLKIALYLISSKRK